VNPLPSAVAAGFISLTLLLAAVLVAGVHRAAGWRKAAVVGAVLAVWLAFSGVLAARGVLMDFTSLPPRIAVVVLPPILLALAIGFGAADGLVRVLPPRWPVAAQTFRVGVEILLAQLASAGLIAEMMSWRGANFDVLTGLTAPLAAWLAFRGGRFARGWMAAWNVGGLALLVNVVARGLLSAPTPFRMIVTDPPNTVVARFPVVWLPAFLVATAFVLHVVSLRQVVLAGRVSVAAPAPSTATLEPARRG
jgi:hypothetical protein